MSNAQPIIEKDECIEDLSVSFLRTFKVCVHCQLTGALAWFGPMPDKLLSQRGIQAGYFCLYTHYYYYYHLEDHNHNSYFCTVINCFLLSNRISRRTHSLKKEEKAPRSKCEACLFNLLYFWTMWIVYWMIRALIVALRLLTHSDL